MLATPTLIRPQPGIMKRLWREVTREGVREEEELPLGKRQEMEPVSGTK